MDCTLRRRFGQNERPDALISPFAGDGSTHEPSAIKFDANPAARARSGLSRDSYERLCAVAFFKLLSTRTRETPPRQTTPSGMLAAVIVRPLKERDSC